MEITELINNKYTTLDSINAMLDKDVPYISKDDWYNLALVALQANKNTAMLQQFDYSLKNIALTVEDLPDITVNKITDFPIFATVATTGDYTDLINKPIIPELPEFAVVALSGDYDDLLNKPTIPTLPTLAIVATSGSYSDLLNKPTIPVLPALATVATSGKYNDLTSKPALKTVATTGAYADLTGKPIIPTVGALNTTATGAQATQVSESLENTIVLHKVSKTGSYTDLRNTPIFGTAAYKDVGTSNGDVPTLNASGKLALATIPTGTVQNTVPLIGAGGKISRYLVPNADGGLLGTVAGLPFSNATTKVGATYAQIIIGDAGDAYAYYPIVDTAMSDSSINLVQNKVVKAYVDTAITAAISDTWGGSY